MAQRRHQMALAQARARDEHDIGFLFDEVQMEQVLDEQAVDLGRPVPVKLINRFEYGKLAWVMQRATRRSSRA